ncbi:MAG: C40 family peptidase [Flavobacteriaceae bacterium]|jgi:lipoprotein Spr|nr:C40 family peptidase [Flavobacteriaceae bacterium]
MKKKVLFYPIAIIAVFSLQSCVTNYVVSNPIDYSEDYQINIKQAFVNQQKVESAKKDISYNFGENAVQMPFASMENSLKSAENAEIEKKYNATISEILEEAETYLGTPYRYGGTSRSGIDCSGFVLSVFGSAIGMSLPRIAATQSIEGERVEKSELKKGDLLFFSQGRRISHVGIVHDIDENGEVRFIHASTSKGVTISSLNDSYWKPRYRFAKRVIDSKQVS